MCDQEPKKFKLHYFGGRGRAEFIRYILAAGKVDFEDNRITFEEWPEIKKTMPTGQLPVLEFECCGKTVMLPQSIAIAEFAAKVAGLYPECKVAGAKSMAGVLTAMDFHESWLPWYKAKLMEKDEEKAAAEWKKVMEEKLPHFAGLVEKRLAADDKPFLAGDKPLWADLVIADIVDRVLTCHKETAAFDDYPKLKAHCEAVHQVPGLKEYVEKREFTSF